MRIQSLLSLLVINRPDRDFCKASRVSQAALFQPFPVSVVFPCPLPDKHRWAINSSSGMQKSQDRFSVFCSIVPFCMEKSAVTVRAATLCRGLAWLWLVLRTGAFYLAVFSQQFPSLYTLLHDCLALCFVITQQTDCCHLPGDSRCSVRISFLGFFSLSFLSHQYVCHLQTLPVKNSNKKC